MLTTSRIPARSERRASAENLAPTRRHTAVWMGQRPRVLEVPATLAPSSIAQTY